MNKLSKITRILLGVTSLSLIATYFVPLWQILLWAPQYPEGLTMKIWVNKLSGEVDIINGLNHYIGMKHISVEMFPEVQFLGLLIGFLIAVGVLAAVLGNARILFFFTLLSYVYGVAAMWDFWRWGYDYGHNLDPNAAIKVPDMSYQPPLIGYKNLLNFTSYSGPDTGAWMIIGVCLLATGLWWWEFLKHKKSMKTKPWTTLAMGIGIVLGTTLLVSSCTSGPEPIRYGQDNCMHCKMTLTDKRFGSEIVTGKGKVFKFDDLNCLVAYLDGGELAEADVAQIVAVDFTKTGAFVDVQKAFFLQNEALKSPMRADIASFSDPADLAKVKAEVGGGQEMNWEAVRKSFQ
ncbi:MAG: nitrous oxide reductase accessory protein NosL [Saprospiraceae bacterium]|nr:nitrous oxide reductase accessory protein NosL [Saprospiraceae bacterium]